MSKEPEAHTKEYEELVKQLKKVKEEFFQFTYIISHDLKAPLRAISNLSEWIEEDIGLTVSEETSNHLRLLRQRVKRLEYLIDGILQYSRIGRIKTPVEVVDTYKLVNKIIALLAPPPTLSIYVQPDMPKIETEYLRLEQVFLNLIKNAIEFHNSSNGHIEILVSEIGDFYEFTVKDDGPGIAPEYHEKIFGIFQSLVLSNQPDSIGMGLVLVKKIVEEYGGSVKLESNVGQGAAFRFTWPKRVIYEK